MASNYSSDPKQALSVGNPAAPQSDLAGNALAGQTPLTNQQRLVPGTVLSTGRYKIEKLVAAGGMGAVYRAVDTRFARPCAVKEMLDTFRSESERAQAAEWFKREATLLL
ncbi:MAG TPA: hypothetical protein VKX46_15370, partial [Ktedonobacteraceae bacterium]|nr:hypothetical protein [Ktedonobacteraceae bacterium]